MEQKENKRNIEEVFDKYYGNIRECIKGLNEIFRINFYENNIYYKMGKDNLKALHENVIELLKYTYSPREVRIKLRENEYDELEAEKLIL